MSAIIIVIEIIIGLVVLAAAVRFAIRDARERSGSSVDAEGGPTGSTATPAHAAEPEAAAQMSEVGSTETSWGVG